jgi:hypothetical protein
MSAAIASPLLQYFIHDDFQKLRYAPPAGVIQTSHIQSGVEHCYRIEENLEPYGMGESTTKQEHSGQSS